MSKSLLNNMGEDLRIRLSKSSISALERDAVDRVMQAEFLGMGPETQLFEQELSDYFCRHVSVVNTGTSAIQLCLQALGVGEGDEVIVPTITYLASFQAVSATGAVPVSADIDLSTGNLNLKSAISKISEKTKAVIWVHYAGDPAGFNELEKEFNKHDIPVIEDAAHAFGSAQHGKIVGTMGSYACFSFDGIKNITSGEGGAVVTNNSTVKSYVDDARLLGVTGDSKNRFNKKRTWVPEVTIQGWRYHMNDVSAAIGRVQLRRSESFFQARQNLAKYYDYKLANHEGLQLFTRDYTSIVPHIYPIRVKNNKRDLLRDVLEHSGIQCGIHYYPNHLLKKYQIDHPLPFSETLYQELLTLPLHTDLSYQNVDEVSACICDYLN